MDNTEARDWANDFENKEKSELLAMISPEGLGKDATDEWWLARARAIDALDDAEDSAASGDQSEIPPEIAPEITSEIAPEIANDDSADAPELALAHEEQAQQGEVAGRMSQFSAPAPGLDGIAPDFARPQARAIRNDGDTEHLLNGLIAECHLLMRAVTLPSAMRAGDADTRRDFLRSAMDIATVGAKVGRAVAKLRGAGITREIRQRHISERVYTGPAPLLENGAKT